MTLLNKSVKAVLVAGIMFGLVGCASHTKGAKGAGEGGEVNTSAIGDMAHFYGKHVSAEEEKHLLAKKVYHFDFDKFDVKHHDMLSIYAHAKNLILNPHKQVRIEGHTDKFGSHEYNIALGQRRANAVAQILKMKGVSDKQIAIVSYGKEKPANSADNKEAHAENRRGVIVYEVE